jgi:hypothetical protein
VLGVQPAHAERQIIARERRKIEIGAQYLL